MNTLKRNATWISLTGLALVAIGLFSRAVIGSYTLWMEILLGVGAVLTLSYLLLAPQNVRKWFGGRQARYGSNSALMMVALAAILVIVNILANGSEKRWDVTEEGLYTLSQESKDVIALLDEPVDIKLFYTSSNYSLSEVENLMTQYAAESDMISYEFIDPDTDRTAALAYGIDTDGTTIFIRGDRQETTYGTDESDLTSTLLKVTRDEATKVYFITGNGERNIDAYDTYGLDTIVGELEAQFYEVSTINLSIEAIPSDADLVIVADPTEPYDDQEMQYLRDYLSAGGGMMIMLEPGEQTAFEELLAEYGVLTPDTLVVDVANGFYGDVATPIVDTYEYHQITNDLTGMSSVFSTVRALEIDQTVEDWNVTMLVSSSDYSWAEVDYTADQVEQNDTEIAGPVGMMAAVSADSSSDAEARLVVVGDADFCSNTVLYSITGSANTELFLNAAAWLTQDDALLSISPTVAEDRTVTLSSSQSRMIMYSNIIFVPLIVLLAGVYVWWRRR